MRELLAYLLNNAPPNLQFLIGSRRPLELQLTDLLAAGRMTELDARDWIAGLEKGLSIIEAFDAAHPRLTATEAGVRCTMTRTAARRYLLTLGVRDQTLEQGSFNVTTGAATVWAPTFQKRRTSRRYRVCTPIQLIPG